MHYKYRHFIFANSLPFQKWDRKIDIKQQYNASIRDMFLLWVITEIV